MAPSTRRPWYRRAASLFESLTAYRQAHRLRRTALGLSTLEERIVPVVAWPDPVYRWDADCNLVADVLQASASKALGGSTALAANANTPGGFSAGPVRYANGTIKFDTTDFTSDGFGLPWTQTRSWSNDPNYSDGNSLGNGWVDTQFPTFYEASKTTVVLVSNGTNARMFRESGGVYTEDYGGLNTLTFDSTNDVYKLTTPDGTRYKFAGFGSSHPAGQKGELLERTDARDNGVTITRDSSTGQVAEVVRGGSPGTTESWLYTYIASGTNAGLLESVTLRRKVGSGSYATARKAVYDYHTGDSRGNAGDLKTATILDAADNVLGTEYYRYYTSNTSPGYTGGLKYYFSQASYARAVGAGVDPLADDDEDIDDYADNYFEYDATTHAVVAETVQGHGCSSCSAGLGDYTFTYTGSSNADGFNAWKTKTTETLPDGNQNIVYTNAYGQVMVQAFFDGTNTWATYYRYDDDGRCVLKAEPSAVTGFSQSYPDLVNFSSGTATYLADTAGLIATYEYVASGSTAGYWLGYDIQRGDTGTPVRQLDLAYDVTYSDGTRSIHPLTSMTVYRNAGSSGGLTTTYTYTVPNDSIDIQAVTVTHPVVSGTTQNGPGSTGDQETFVSDGYGRVLWTKDGGGFIHYSEYDDGTGALVKAIADVNSSTVTGLLDPQSWTTPSGGGLHLIETRDTDHLGRTTKLTTPEGRVSYFVYDDVNHSARGYVGWTGSAATLPTTVVREDRARGYTETLTMAATPAVSGGVPTGTESIGSLQSLSRSYRSAAGQLTHTDAYFSLSGLTYTTGTTFGTAGTNFSRTTFAYNQRGRPTKDVTPNGTITRTERDGRGRPTTVWVGTDDVPSTGYWSITNTAGTNMVKVGAYTYDGGGVGDGNLTTMILYPVGTTEPRQTDHFHDWRNRRVATKTGEQSTTESGTMNRPIFYVEYDNLNQVVASERYDGDEISVTTTNGVPVRPSSSELRAKSVYSYDDRMRLFRTEFWGVTNSGSVSSNPLKSDQWYDRRGNVIKSTAPGGASTKTAFDGAGRATFVYTSDASGDSGGGDADDVTGDTVLEQAEYAYDDDGNILMTTTRQRFHGETDTGALGGPTDTVQARVSFVVSYFDPASRMTATANVGTYNGSTYTRPGTVPSRSDTVLVTSYGYHTSGGWLQSITDPKGTVTRTSHDNLGRVIETVENYTGGSITTTANKTTQFTYDGSGHLLTYKLLLPSSAYQETQYVYGSSSSTVVSNEWLAEVRHPDKTTGAASTSERDYYGYNALGEVTAWYTRNSTYHHYSFDLTGRPTRDGVAPVGTGVSNLVRRLDTTYDGQGNAYQFSTYDTYAGTTLLNQVQRDFNGWGQLTAEWQEHSGAVTSSSAKVQYGYSEMPSGANHSRMTSWTLPAGNALTVRYDSGLDAAISRMSGYTEGSTSVLGYAYLGWGSVVERSNGVTKLTLIGAGGGDGGDQYNGLDRFGRVVDWTWKTVSGGTVNDRYQYGYDRVSNRLWRDNLNNSAFGELYSYDALNQLTAMLRGTLNSTKTGLTGSATRTQSWTADAAGNFTDVTTDGVSQSRSADRQNQMTALGSATPTYDYDGNLNGDGTWTFVYDAWDRLVEATDGTTTVAYAYDVLGRRITETVGSTTTHLYYNMAWQVVEERVGGTGSTNLRAQYVWSPAGSDMLVYRDRDTNADGTLDERLFVQQDVQGNVTALVNTSGSVVERYAYDAYGKATVYTATWGTPSGGGTQYAWKYYHQGLRFDANVSLYDNRMRVYSAEYMRFLQDDPIGFAAGDQNTYRYVRNSPIKFIDPTGYFTSLQGCMQSPAAAQICIEAGIVTPAILALARSGQQIAQAAPSLVQAVCTAATTVIMGNPHVIPRVWEQLDLGPKPQNDPRVDPKPHPEPRAPRRPSRRTREECEEQRDDDNARCDRIREELKREGYSPAEVGRWCAACRERANDRRNACYNGGQPPDPYPKEEIDPS